VGVLFLWLCDCGWLAFFFPLIYRCFILNRGAFHISTFFLTCFLRVCICEVVFFFLHYWILSSNGVGLFEQGRSMRNMSENSHKKKTPCGSDTNF